LCGCRTWSLKLREKSGSVFKIRELRNTFGPKREEVAGRKMEKTA
jgi:hypothetical protein